MQRKWLVGAAVAVLTLVIIVILMSFLDRPQDVEIIHPSKHEVIELVIASGRLRAKRISNVGSEVTGTVASVLVDEGDDVSAGQVVIKLDSADAQQQLAQANLAAQTAQRQLEVVSRGPLPEEVAKAEAQVAQAQKVGQAKVKAAQNRLKDLKQGRAEERKRAQAQLDQAHATRLQAEADLGRTKKLAAEGAVSSQDLDRAVTTARQAQAAERVARQALNLAARPASANAIAAANADLQAAQSDYQQSTKIAQENLALVLRGARIEDIRLAQSKLSEAKAAVALAQEELSKRTIRSPISGYVTLRDVEPGESVTAGKTLLIVTSLKNSEIYVETDETNLPKLRVGQSAIIIPPSFPNQPFRAAVKQIGPEVDTERGIVGVRLRPVALPDYARPDMTVDANIEVAHLPSALSVPTSSLLTQGTQNYVLVYQNGRAIRRDVQVLARGARWIGVKGVTRDDRVIVNATEISPGQRVRIAGRS